MTGPRIFVNQPGHEMKPKEIEFEGRIELIDLNAKEDKQLVKIFVTYGKGAKFSEEKLPKKDLAFSAATESMRYCGSRTAETALV